MRLDTSHNRWVFTIQLLWGRLWPLFVCCSPLKPLAGLLWEITRWKWTERSAALNTRCDLKDPLAASGKQSFVSGCITDRTNECDLKAFYCRAIGLLALTALHRRCGYELHRKYSMQQIAALILRSLVMMDVVRKLRFLFFLFLLVGFT